MKKIYLLLVAMLATMAVSAAELTVYFNNDQDWANPSIWCWDNSQNYTGGKWPGYNLNTLQSSPAENCTVEMENIDDKEYYKITFNNISSIDGTQIIFSGNGSQTADLKLVDGEKYNCSGVEGKVVKYYLIGTSINGQANWDGILFDENMQVTLKSFSGQFKIKDSDGKYYGQDSADYTLVKNPNQYWLGEQKSDNCNVGGTLKNVTITITGTGLSQNQITIKYEENAVDDPAVADSWYYISFDGDSQVLDQIKFTQSSTDKNEFTLAFDGDFECPAGGFVPAFVDAEGNIDWNNSFKTNTGGELVMANKTYSCAYGMGTNLFFRSTYKNARLTINTKDKTLLLEGEEDLAPVTIMFRNKMNWEKVYLYVWNMKDGVATEIVGSFPGREMTQKTRLTDGEEYYYYTYTPLPSDTRKIIFSNGPNKFEGTLGGNMQAETEANVSAGNQTPDLSLRRNTVYYRDGSFQDIENLRPAVPERLFLITTVDDGKYAGFNETIELGRDGNVFTVDGIYFGSHETGGKARFQFVTEHNATAAPAIQTLAEEAETYDWTKFVDGHFVHPLYDGRDVSEAGVVITPAADVEKPASFAVAPGLHKVSVDYNTFVPTVTVSEATLTGVEGIVSDDSNAPVEYYNLEGVRVANPANGIYIRRQGNTVTKIVR